MKKVCKKCSLEKEMNLYSKCVANKDGLQDKCKPCKGVEFKEWRVKNIDYDKKRQADFRTKNPLYSQNYRTEHPDYYKVWQQSRKATRNQNEKEKRKNNIHFRLSTYLRNRLNAALNGKIKAGSAIKELGCSVEFLKKHLESQFVLGMTWKNHGKWHIDHKIPISKCDLTTSEGLAIACHYTNLQPLWKTDNLRKGNKEIL